MEQLLLKLAPLLQGAGGAAASAVPPAAAVMQGIPQLYKLALAAKEAQQARQIERTLTRPVQQVPGSVREATGLARMEAFDTSLPGGSAAVANLLRSAAGARQGIMSSGGGGAERAAAMAAVGAGTDSAMDNLAAAAAEQQARDTAALGNQLNRQGQWEHDAWEWNQRDKYISAAQKAEALRDAARRNVYSGLMGVGGAAASTLRPAEPRGLEPRVTSRLEPRRVKTVGSSYLDVPDAQGRDAYGSAGKMGGNTAPLSLFNPNKAVPMRESYTPLFDAPDDMDFGSTLFDGGLLGGKQQFRRGF